MSWQLRPGHVLPLSLFPFKIIKQQNSSTEYSKLSFSSLNQYKDCPFSQSPPLTDSGISGVWPYHIFLLKG